MTANRQYTEGGPRGVHGPRTDGDFRGEVARQDRPLMGHEIGQWTFFPNFDEIAKYTGVLQAKNFELVRDDLAKKHLLDLAPQFVQATGRHAVLLYKEEIEVLLRTPNYPGFSLLDLHDYPGQGTALIGPLDPFWDSKGFVTPGAAHPLLRADRAAAAIEEADLHQRRDLDGRGRDRPFRPQGSCRRHARVEHPRRKGRGRRRGHVASPRYSHRQAHAAGADRGLAGQSAPRRASSRSAFRSRTRPSRTSGKSGSIRRR